MATQPDVGLLGSPFIPAILIFGVFYFLVFRPQKQRQKSLEAMRSGLQKNDRVVSAGGIHGTIVQVKDKTVVVRVDDSVKIEFDKESISSIVKSTKDKTDIPVKA